jgi:hypothetical protein
VILPGENRAILFVEGKVVGGCIEVLAKPDILRQKIENFIV